MQCFGLVANSATTYDACLQACCNTATCAMFEWCPSNVTCSGYREACYIGVADLSKCTPQANWQGAARVLPPAPPRIPQLFLPPYTLSPTLPLADLDLADEIRGVVWSLKVDNDKTRQILVPGGGYNSDRQARPWIDSLNVSSTATYSRIVDVPAWFGGADSVLHLAFGAVNHGAEVYVAPVETPENRSFAGAHYGPHMAFDVDVTAYMQVGRSYVLTVVARPFAYFHGDVASGFRYPETWSRPANGWSSRQCGGICKYVRLIALPSLRVSSLYVHANVSSVDAIVIVEVQVTNEGVMPLAASEALLSCNLSSWNYVAHVGTRTSSWPYPALYPIALPSIAPKSSITTTFAILWSLGPASYWWPNMPFNSSYAPQVRATHVAV